MLHALSEIKVTVWNEYRHEKQNEHVAGIYPEGIHNATFRPD